MAEEKAKPSCGDVITACDKALAHKDGAIGGLQMVVLQRDELIKMQKTTIEEQDAKLSAWYRNPWLLLGLGVVAGMAIKR